MALEALVQGVRDALPAGGAATSASSASARSRSPTTIRLDPARRSARSRPAREGSGATPTSCPFSERPRDPLEPGLTPLVRADRLAEHLGAGGAVDQERRRQPDPLVQGSRRRGRAGEGARARLRDRRLRLDGQPRQRRRRPCGRRRASTHTSSFRPTSRSRSCSPPGSTAPRWSASAAPTTTSTGSAPSSARRGHGRSSTSTCARTTPRARRPSPTRPPSSSAGRCPTGSSARSPRARCSRRSAAASRVARARAGRGRAAGVQRRPGDGLRPGRDRVRRGLGRLQAAAARHDRQEPRDRRPGRRALRARPGAPHRRLGRLRHRRRDPRRHPPAGRDDRHLHRDRRRRHRRDAGQARRGAARSVPPSASSSTSPARA